MQFNLEFLGSDPRRAYLTRPSDGLRRLLGRKQHCVFVTSPLSSSVWHWPGPGVDHRWERLRSGIPPVHLQRGRSPRDGYHSDFTAAGWDPPDPTTAFYTHLLVFVKAASFCHRLYELHGNELMQKKKPYVFFFPYLCLLWITVPICCNLLQGGGAAAFFLDHSCLQKQHRSARILCWWKWFVAADLFAQSEYNHV